MEQQLKVIAFISGGKDSIFSLLHCFANGHQIIALANLYPPVPKDGNGEDSDLNSFMYQTVGHTLIPLYADVLSLPLYRQDIHGTAINHSKYYSVPESDSPQDGTSMLRLEEDETESMITLLGRIRKDHPEANAVCSGAILSTYQRTRIESVSLRMGLVPLAYLWQYPTLPMPEPREGGLLEDMAFVGLDARIIKVASGGLDHELLWENVCTEPTRKRMAKAMKRFGGSVLGEGGEFETLVVDGPSPVFKAVIGVLEEQRKVIQGGGGEAWMAFTGGCIKKKEGKYNEDSHWLEKLRIPDQLDPNFQRLLETLDYQIYRSEAGDANVSVVQPPDVNHDWEDTYHIYTGKWTARISNISASNIAYDAEAQMESIKRTLLSILEGTLHRSAHDILFTTILLRSMDDFQGVNHKYADLFSARPNPPARVTVACGDSLPQGVHVMVSVIISLHPKEYRQCLHIQSRSYWAPANIGPYSQAASIPLDIDRAGAMVFVAGQIPLVPASMEIVTRTSPAEAPKPMPDLLDFRLHTTLALQHVWRIGKVMNVGWWTGAIAFLVAGEDDIEHKAFTCASAWKVIHTQEDESGSEESLMASDDAKFDVWNQQQFGTRSFETEQADDTLPDISMLSVINSSIAQGDDTNTAVPPFFAVEVAQLPRQSEIEWQALGVSRTAVKVFEKIFTDDVLMTACSIASNEIVQGFIGINSIDVETDIMAQIEQEILGLEARYGIPNIRNGHKTIYMSYQTDCSKFRAQIIPCRSVWDCHGAKLAAAVVLHYEVGDEGQSLHTEESTSRASVAMQQMTLTRKIMSECK